MALAEITGLRRGVNVLPVAEGAPETLLGKWVLIHVGFAMALIDEAEAARTLEVLHQMGEAQEELDAMEASVAGLD